MSELGWASPEWLSTPPEQNEILLHCIARYHAFMDLLSSSFSLFAVPTLDIDLAWHTHQLQSSYRIDTAQAVGRAIDHNDKVEETDLGYGFDDTAKLWEVSLTLTAMDYLTLIRDDRYRSVTKFLIIFVDVLSLKPRLLTKL